MGVPHGPERGWGWDMGTAGLDTNCFVFLYQGEAGLLGSPGQTGPPGPLVRRSRCLAPRSVHIVTVGFHTCLYSNLSLHRHPHTTDQPIHLSVPLPQPLPLYSHPEMCVLAHVTTPLVTLREV